MCNDNGRNRERILSFRVSSTARIIFSSSILRKMLSNSQRFEKSLESDASSRR